MKTHLENRAGDRRTEDRRRELTPGQKVHLGWMLSEERRKNDRRDIERRTY
jgi:hypothetical protein